jgi:hypothetical protein
MPDFGAAIQTNKIPVLGLTPESNGTAPASPAVGQLWADTSTSPSTVRYWDGTAWIRANGADIPDGTVTNAKVAAGAAIALSKLAVDPLARANHTGTQAAATISDLAGTVQAYRLDQFAVPTSAVGVNGQRITNLGAPSAASDAARLADVQGAAAGLDVKPSVRAASTANVNIASAPAAIDGVTLAGGDRVLLKNQTTASENGSYTFNGTGSALTRTGDAIGPNSFWFVEEGTTGADTAWVVTTDAPITVGTTALSIAQFGSGTAYVAGAGLTLTGNTLDVVAADGSVVVNADSVTVGNVPVTKGGTGATTAAAARSNLAALTAYSADLGALSAGVAANITHNLGTEDVQIYVRETSGGKGRVYLDEGVVDSNTISLKADIAYSAAALRVTVQAKA